MIKYIIKKFSIYGEYLNIKWFVEIDQLSVVYMFVILQEQRVCKKVYLKQLFQCYFEWDIGGDMF